MNLLILFFVGISIAILYLLFRFILFRLGYKDSNYPIVQRAERKEKKKDTSLPFLPGSRMEYVDLEKTLSTSMEVHKVEKKKKKARRFTQRELRHAIILEELLHPKFKEGGHKNHNELHHPPHHGEDEHEKDR